MIGWLLDTNVIAELIRARGAARVKAWAEMQGEATLHLSILTIGEYDKGIANLAEGDDRRAYYASLRDGVAERFAGRVLAVSDPIIRRWGSISGAVRRETGHPPPVIDTMLAATAVEHDLYLATRDTRDVSMSGAALFDPWKDEPGDFPILSGRRRRRGP